MSTERSSYTSAAEWLYQNAPNPPIRDEFTPIVIFHDRVARGIGTLWKRQDATHIVTACHIFSWSFGFGFWTYRIPHDSVPRMYPIESAQPLKPVPGYEIAICLLPQLIYSPYFRGWVNYNADHMLAEMFNCGTPVRVGTGQRYTSLATGKMYRHVTSRKFPNGEIAILIDKSGSTPGESGTGFIDNQGRLYVLSFVLQNSPERTQGSGYSALFQVPEYKLQTP